MGKIDEAIDILRSLGLPPQQQNERSALTLLALAAIGERDAWRGAAATSIGIHGIAAFAREYYRRDYAENTREAIRRQTVHQFEQACVVDRNRDAPSRPTNSPRTVYCLTDDCLKVLQAYGTRRFRAEVAAFVEKHGELRAAYDQSRRLRRIPLRLPKGKILDLSPGRHNELEKAVVEEFGPRFAPGSQVLFVGDTAKKYALCDETTLARLGISVSKHDKLPDVVLFDPSRRWLFLIEAVASHGPVNAKRHKEMEIVLRSCQLQRVYVTAFLDRATFRKHAADIAWETEVWIAESPDHMVHFNGPKFLGPYKSRQS